MTNLTPSSADVRKLAKLLDEGEFDSAKDMAQAALEMAFEAYESRANFVIVGQLHYSPDLGYAKDQGDKVAFGPYGTLGKARDAFSQLAYGSATNEEFKCWLLPYHQGTPAQWFLHRKKVRQLQEDVPLTGAERLIVRHNPETSHLWGLTKEGGRIKQDTGEQEAEAA